MERAGQAMQQIHGKLNIDKVDETMYVIFRIRMLSEDADMLALGRNFENNMHSARKLPRPSQVHLLVSLSTRQNWMMSWQSLSRSS